jgi:hypothetical protein
MSNSSSLDLKNYSLKTAYSPENGSDPNNTTTPPFVTEFMELEKWIISKAENKSYQEVLQQKLRKK